MTDGPYDQETELDTPKFPDAIVQLTGQDGNAGNILAQVNIGLRRAGASRAEINEFREEALSGDYNHLLRTALKWVTVQ